MMFIEGKKNGNPGLKLLPPLYAHEENGDYTVEINDFFCCLFGVLSYQQLT